MLFYSKTIIVQYFNAGTVSVTAFPAWENVTCSYILPSLSGVATHAFVSASGVPKTAKSSMKNILPRLQFLLFYLFDLQLFTSFILILFCPRFIIFWGQNSTASQYFKEQFFSHVLYFLKKNHKIFCQFKY
jgi:hypothetical protein